MKLSEFVKHTNIPAKLVRAVVRQLGGWEEFSQVAQDVARHGAAAGWCGFTYYTDTVTFTKRNKREILELAKQCAEDLGESGTIALIASFRCLRDWDFLQEDIAKAIYTGKGEAVQGVYNALAWYALEEVARAYDDLSSEF